MSYLLKTEKCGGIYLALARFFLLDSVHKQNKDSNTPFIIPQLTLVLFVLNQASVYQH